MKYLLYAVLGLVALVVLFVIWRLSSVGRGARRRDRRILEVIGPLLQRLSAGEKVAQDEVRELARLPQVRYPLFAALRELDRPDLLPDDFSSTVQQAESCLTYWMMHPNELQDPPQEMELVETVRRSVAGEEGEFHVFRYRMPEGHWAAESGWILGFAGPYHKGREPYDEITGAFSRVGDVEGSLEPSEIVDWYLDMMRQKGYDI